MQEKPQAVVYTNYKILLGLWGKPLGGGSACVLAGVQLSATSFYGAAGPLDKKGGSLDPKRAFCFKGIGRRQTSRQDAVPGGVSGRWRVTSSVKRRRPTLAGVGYSGLSGGGWVGRPTPWWLVGDHLDQMVSMKARRTWATKARGRSPWASGSAAANSTASNSKIPSDTQPLIVAMVVLGV